MTAKRFILFLFIICGLPSVLTGCFGTSPDSRFYTLTPVENRNASLTTSPDAAVIVGPITIPDYLDRRQIVTRSGQNRIVLAEFDRWGGSLDGEIMRVLVASLADRLVSRRIAVFPWKFAPLAEARTVYRIPVSVARFDGTPGEKVVLNAAWEVFVKGDKQEESLFTTESVITEEIKGKGYEELVAAMGKAVEMLGKEMADSVAAVIAKKNPN
jgi:uncharacterized lipoprotein YmbA